MLKFTKHSIIRMKQRGITQEMVELSVKYGKYINDKVIFNTNVIKEVLDELDDKLKIKILRILDKRSVIVIVKNEIVITTYNSIG